MPAQDSFHHGGELSKKKSERFNKGDGSKAVAVLFVSEEEKPWGSCHMAERMTPAW